MANVRVKIGIKNDTILTAMEKMGYKTIADFAKDVGIHYTTVSSIIGFRYKPGKITITRLSDFLGIDAFQLMDQYGVLYDKSIESSVEFVAEQHDLPQLDSYSKKFIGTDVESILDTCAGVLSDRQLETLKLRYVKGMQYKKIAEKFGTSTERTRQIAEKAIRAIRASDKKDLLLELLQTN